MNWFAIGAGFAIVIVAISSLAGRGARLPRPAAITLGLVGLLFLYLGAAPGLES